MRTGRLGRIAGIDLHVHWTFALLLAWLLFMPLAQGRGWAAALGGVALVLAVFGCVVLHELGHALTARRYGIRTRDITLYPIGGVARLERMPDNPREELWVALAGPAVNLVIAVALIAAIGLGQSLATLGEAQLFGGGFLVQLAYINLLLAGFNLLPAFPMDGGRVLRALLAMRMDYVRATQYAATAGQFAAVAFGVAGLFFNWFLLFIALFVFIGAQQEAHAVRTRSVLAGVPVREAMVTRFHTLDPDDPLALAVQALLGGEQRDFPVVRGGQLAGILTRDALLAALAQGRQDARVHEAMAANVGSIEDTEMLDRAFERMQLSASRCAPVTREGQLCGLLTAENVGEWMMVQSSLRGVRSTEAVAPASQGDARLAPKPIES